MTTLNSVAATGDAEPAADGGASEAGAASAAQPVSALRDAYVAGRDIIINMIGSSSSHGQREATDPPDGPELREQNASGLGERLFTANAGEHSGKLAVAFGADDTLVITDQDGAIYRWSLSSRTALPEATGSGSPPLGSSVMYGVGTQVAVSTTIPAVAVARGARCSIIHFTGGGYRTANFPLGRDEFLVPASGERFATHDVRRLRIRDFADGRVVWEQPCPRSVATAAIDTRGRTVAMAGASSRFAPSNRFVVTSQDDPHPREFTFENIRVPGAGCQLALSPGGELVVCSSFKEILLARPGREEIVRRRRVGSMREEIVPALGARPQRLICLADGQVLWLRGRRVVDVNWSAPKFRYLTQDGLCDDIAFDHATSRLAMVSESGQVDVFEWRLPAG
jgi:hypothetical protein